MNSGRLLSNPAARGQVAAAAALAGWHGGRIANGWWRHGDGGYGWVGPLFWPFAYHDIYDYTIWGDGIGFWAYGYGDIYAGIFAPYGQDDLAGYTAPGPSGRRHRRVPPLQQLCGDDSREIAGLPIDQIQQAVQLTEAQRAVLDDLANASVSAAQIVRACPTQTASTAPARLAAMQERLQAMIKAELTVQPPLEKFYGLLDDEQKARLNALAEDRRKISATNRARQAQGCQAEPSAALKWPADEIEARLYLNDTQSAALEVLQDTSASAVEMLNAECRPDAMTPPARLAAVNRRLDAMLQAVKLVGDALEDFYANLSGEQNPYAPTFTANFSIDYGIPVGPGVVRPKVTLSHTDKQYASIFQADNFYLLPAKTIFNGSLTWEANPWLVQLYVNNFTDKLYVSGYANNLEYYGNPRQMGIRINRTF